ncbi:hypothetical protein [uncultured Sphaerochaeta sp.]|uniref:hypothetical protein n=1 Tax=uncultured Sphaerochaeta sp. TaxID=886478 RepID=UPI0029CA331A|nr:hypothetical protein [uncultured Sphaerochaeta sp.]
MNHKRVPGGEKTEKTGIKWTEFELEKVLELYLTPEGKKIHENNPAIQALAKSLNRSVRSTEGQMLMYRNLDLGGNYSRGNMNKLCKRLWEKRTVDNTNEETEQDESRLFPNAFFSWSGSSDGAVKRPFETNEKRLIEPIQTTILGRLNSWIEDISSCVNTPRSVFLVGGPGNGKTDAVEETIRKLGEVFGCSEKIESHFKTEFNKYISQGVLPRKVELRMKIGQFEGLQLVQDATVRDIQFEGKSAQELLLDDIEEVVLNHNSHYIYICCVNRGVLAEAIPLADSRNYQKSTLVFLNKVSYAVTPHPNSIQTWPLEDYPDIAIWPMDIESLVDSNLYEGEKTPGEIIFSHITNSALWKNHSNCSAKEYCPFRANQKLLSDKKVRKSLLDILHAYEFISGKRWNFRELFGLVSFIMIGLEKDYGGRAPCEWVREQGEIIARGGNSKNAYDAAYKLVSKLYMHALFPRWPSLGKIRKDFIGKLKNSGNTFDGQREIVQGFLNTLFQRIPDTSSTISTLLYGSFGEALDPVQYSGEKPINKDNTMLIHDAEELFSHSVSLGLERVEDVLIGPERILFQFLKQGEDFLDRTDSSGKLNVAVVKEVHSALKIFAVRLYKRSIGVRFGIYQNCDEISLYKQIQNNTHEMAHLKRSFEKLLNQGSHFHASLVTTFGQPEPTTIRNAILKSHSIPVKTLLAKNKEGRPLRSIHYFKVGNRCVPLTFSLYFALYHSTRGLASSSLPEDIFALLDSTKSYVLGEIVRNQDIIEQVEIILGVRSEVIKYDDMDGFYVE